MSNETDRLREQERAVHAHKTECVGGPCEVCYIVYWMNQYREDLRITEELNSQQLNKITNFDNFTTKLHEQLDETKEQLKSLVTAVRKATPPVMSMTCQSDEQRVAILSERYRQVKQNLDGAFVRITSLEEAVETTRLLIQSLIEWPEEGYDRRTEDGYPQEMGYDEFAYKRMVDTYRESLKAILTVFK